VSCAILSMSTLTKIIIIVSLLLVILVSAYVYKTKSTPDIAKISSDLGIQTSTNNTQTNAVIDLKTITGQIVEVRDFKKDPDVNTWYDESTFLIGDGKRNESNAYQIFYFDTDRSINISLLSEPLGSVRLIAEEQLMKRLGLSKEVLCSLHINVGTPGFVSAVYAGQNLGLSFCPGSVKLP
jgi:hypothetical protein